MHRNMRTKYQNCFWKNEMARLVIDTPQGIPAFPLQKALVDLAAKYGCKVISEPARIGLHYRLERVYQTQHTPVMA